MSGMDLLGRRWGHFPERNLQRHWCQPSRFHMPPSPRLAWSTIHGQDGAARYLLEPEFHIPFLGVSIPRPTVGYAFW